MGCPLEKFRNLCNHNPEFSTEEFKLPGIHFKTGNFFPFTYRGDKYLTFISSNDDYFRIDILTEFFQEEPRMRARRCDQKISPFEFWNSPSGSMDVVKKVMGLKQEINTYNLREGLYGAVKECTQFKCTLTRAIIQKLRGTRILDFSAGWGDRLIGSISANVEYYLGVDPNTDLIAGHSAAVEYLAKPEFRNNFRIIYAPFQSCDIPEDKYFDLVFTSPPFFNFEIYTEQEGQSVKDFPRFSDWLVSFLLVSVRKAWSRLLPGGHLALHLTDTRGSQCCEVMNLFVQSKLEGAVYEGVIAARGVSDLPRPIWVWRKVVVGDMKDEEKKRVGQAVWHLRDHFGDMFKEIEKHYELGKN